MLTSGAVSLERTEPRTRTSLLLESIALRHQIAVLKRSRTRRPCFRRFDRLFWILLSHRWLDWRESLVIVQPETVLRWRRDGWSALWKYRSRGRWRGGRPRVSGEIRGLIARMARENFLWGAPRGSTASFSCSGSASPKPPCRATCRRQTDGRDSRGGPSFAIKPVRSASIPRSGPTDTLARKVRPIRLISCNPRLRELLIGQQQPTLKAERVNLRSAQRDRGVTHGARRVAYVPGGSRRALENRSGAALPIRSPPHEAWASPCLWPRDSRRRVSSESRQISLRRSKHWQIPACRPRICLLGYLPRTIELGFRSR
jgi:hypothetical protein